MSVKYKVKVHSAADKRLNFDFQIFNLSATDMWTAESDEEFKKDSKSDQIIDKIRQRKQMIIGKEWGFRDDFFKVGKEIPLITLTVSKSWGTSASLSEKLLGDLKVALVYPAMVVRDEYLTHLQLIKFTIDNP